MPDYGDSGGFQGSGGGQAATGGVGPQDTTNYGGYEDEDFSVDQPAGTGVLSAQQSFNSAHGITDTNPYGINGFFSRVFGINPKHISYASNMSLATRQAIANNQFSKFANPQNIPGQIGYNPAFPTAEKGKLRSGVQKAGYNTQYGKVMEQYAEQSPMQMAARGIMGLLGGPIGLAVSQIGTQEYGLPGQPGFESFDPNNPRGPQTMLGKFASLMTGGVDPTQAAAYAANAGEQLADFFTPDQPAPSPANTQIQQVAPDMPNRETYADQRDRENALLSGIFGMSTQKTNNLQDYMPVEGMAEQDAISTNPLGYQEESTLYDPTDMYGMLTQQLAQPATPYSALSMEDTMARKLSKGMGI